MPSTSSSQNRPAAGLVPARHCLCPGRAARHAGSAAHTVDDTGSPAPLRSGPANPGLTPARRVIQVQTRRPTGGLSGRRRCAALSSLVEPAVVRPCHSLSGRRPPWAHCQGPPGTDFQVRDSCTAAAGRDPARRSALKFRRRPRRARPPLNRVGPVQAKRRAEAGGGGPLNTTEGCVTSRCAAADHCCFRVADGGRRCGPELPAATSDPPPARPARRQRRPGRRIASPRPVAVADLSGGSSGGGGGGNAGPGPGV